MPRGGKRDGAGRKATEDRSTVKTTTLLLKLTQDQKNQLKLKAEQKGISMTDLLLSVLD